MTSNPPLQQKKVKGWVITHPETYSIYSFPFEYLGNQHLSKDHECAPIFPSKQRAQDYLKDRKNNGLDKKYKVVPVEIKILTKKRI